MATDDIDYGSNRRLGVHLAGGLEALQPFSLPVRISRVNVPTELSSPSTATVLGSSRNPPWHLGARRVAIQKRHESIGPLFEGLILLNAVQELFEAYSRRLVRHGASAPGAATAAKIDREILSHASHPPRKEILTTSTTPKLLLQRESRDYPCTLLAGQNLLSIKDRNDAIRLKTLQSYLTKDEDRTKWCNLADDGFRKQIPQGRVVEKTARINPFIQTWDPLQKKLPRPLKRLYQTAKKFDLKFDALALTKDVKEEIPVWFHPGGKKDLSRHNNSKCANCLRDIHGVRTVGHVLEIVRRNYHQHYRRRNCACNICRSDRAAGCDSPYKCHEEAVKILDCIDEKWDPRMAVNMPNPELTPEEVQQNSEAISDKDCVIFDPKMTLQNLSGGFRIFAGEVSNTPANQLDPIEGEDEPSEVAVFVECSHSVNDDGEYCSSGGLWYGPEDPRNSTIRVAKDLSSRYAGQTAAILHAIQNLPWETSIHFCLKSKRIIRTLTTNLAECEDNDWADTEDKHLLKVIAVALRAKGTRCTLREASESDIENMRLALELATQGLDEGDPTVLITEIPLSYDLKGIKLKAGSQRTFYKAIQANRPKPQRRKTTIMLDMTRHATRILSGSTPTDSQIWLSIRHQDISRTTRDFMWRCLHQAYKVGEYWRNIPNYEHYATCPHCRVDESMEHILLECDAPGQEKLWNLAQELWELKGYAWPEMDLGRISACGLVDVRDAKGKRDEGGPRELLSRQWCKAHAPAMHGSWHGSARVGKVRFDLSTHFKLPGAGGGGLKSNFSFDVDVMAFRMNSV
ncbi:hypothetical protein C8F04DRAFT_1184821 [Mycena alexandri]|uniref:Reverse transcriptase zinc-binding domain-containing protein n=1 Tax=Mycena alexandri TaxID=1745969 RepID=A0AAD6ST69_9AGAR|nr:hypothetical protein C8F04DRAFT_1184821 [Mycena alexandri]